MDNRWMGQPTGIWDIAKEYIGMVVVVLMGAFAVIVVTLYYLAIVLLFSPIGWILLIWWLWYA